MNRAALKSRTPVAPAQFSRRATAGLALLLLAGAALWPATGHSQPKAVAAAATPTVQLPDFSELAERMGPSVVNIRTTEKPRSRSTREGVDPNFEEFFRRFGIPMPNNRPDGQRRNAPRDEADEQPTQRGLGSGFVLTSDGFILTNAHVVDGADEVIVTLTDKRELKARIVGADARTDVAVVKVEATGLPAVKIGDVNRLKVGEWVMAIGSPFGLDSTVTAGIVSAKQRDTGEYLNFIQTDVAINPGNSGGPLLNLRGEVVGINSQIYSRSGGFMGISFAIPIDDAIRVADQLRANGRVIRGRIGVQIAPVTKEVAEAIGLGKAAGALVRSVEKDGPADKAGVEAGDIITKVDGKVVDKSADLPRLVGGIKPGTKATLQLFRRGGSKDLSVTVAEFEADAGAAKRAGAEPGAAPSAAKSSLGLSVADLSDAQKKELRVKGGVRVEAVDGAAAKAGLREGDVILSMDNVEVTSAKQFAALAEKAEKAEKGKSVSVLVRRGEWVNYVLIRTGR